MTLYQGILLLIVFLFLFTILAATFYRGERAERIRIYLSAFRVGLRDKGFTGESDGKIWAHTFCLTRARIGIHRKKKIPVQYCWRCEMILSEMNPSDPGEGAPAEGDKDRKVINLADRRK